MNQIISLFIDIMATYRLTKLIVEDRITLEIREKIWEHFPPNTLLGYLITCKWCTSIWAAIVIFSLRKISPASADIVSGLLTASAATGILGDKGI